MIEFNCQHCGGQMRRTKLPGSRAVGGLLGCLTLAALVPLAFVVSAAFDLGLWPLAAAAVLSLLAMVRERKVWRCMSCGSIIDRA